MDWISVSIIYFVMAVAMYVFIRKAQKDEVPIHVYSFFMFAVPLVGTFLIVALRGTSFLVPLPYLLMIVGMAVLLSYLGNYFSQNAILAAANPGYPLIVMKSYVVFTTIAAIFLFGSELNLKNAIAIAAIIGFSILIIVEKKAKRKGNSRWVLLAFAAFFCYGLLALSSKYLIDRGVDPVLQLFHIFLIVSAIMAVDIARRKKGFGMRSPHILLLLGIGVLSLVFNVAGWYGYKVAPNPGYINAINAASSSIVALCCIILFKDEFSWRKMAGIAGVTAGLVLMFLPL
jgi:drug/metabolite transporter (DMT)-like permease